MWLRKKHGQCSIGDVSWEKDGDVVEVPDSLGEELLARKDGEFEEADPPAGHKPSDDAKSKRAAHEVAERAALKARRANESPSGTRLNDGRWAQTDTKGDETVDTGLRDTGAEMAPANVLTASSTEPNAAHKTLTPGSAENKPTRGAPDVDDVQHPGARHEVAAQDQRPAPVSRPAEGDKPAASKPAADTKK